MRKINEKKKGGIVEEARTGLNVINEDRYGGSIDPYRLGFLESGYQVAGFNGYGLPTDKNALLNDINRVVVERTRESEPSRYFLSCEERETSRGRRRETVKECKRKRERVREKETKKERARSLNPVFALRRPRVTGLR